MRNITVSVDDETYRNSRIRAAELDTSVSALVREYLQGLTPEGARRLTASTPSPSDVEQRRRMLNDAIERIRINSPGFSAADNLSREELYDRDRARAEAQIAAGPRDSR